MHFADSNARKLEICILFNSCILYVCILIRTHSSAGKVPRLEAPVYTTAHDSPSHTASSNSLSLLSILSLVLREEDLVTGHFHSPLGRYEGYLSSTEKGEFPEALFPVHI